MFVNAVNASRSVVLLTSAQHYSIGTFLITSGFISGFLNLIGLALLISSPKDWSPSCIPEGSLLLADLAIAGLHPFSGASAIANRWIWGELGCQLYSVAGFLFGNYLLSAVPFVAWDRYITTCRPDSLKGYRSYKSYIKILIGLFCVSVAWAVAPLLGWGRYGLMPHKISCTLAIPTDGPPDAAYSSYVTCLLLFVVFIPFCLSLFFYSKIHAHIKKNKMDVEWAHSGSEMKVMIGCCLPTYAGFSVYGVYSVWPMIFSASTPIPLIIPAMAPLLAKFGSLINPLAYVLCQPKRYEQWAGLFGGRSGRGVKVGGNEGDEYESIDNVSGSIQKATDQKANEEVIPLTRNTTK